MISILETFEVATGSVREILRVDGRVEAPNWSPCGGWLLVNAAGRLYRVPLDRPRLEPVETGAATRCNNDHGITPDGRWIILSGHHEGQGSQIYRIPVAGGEPERISTRPPSWWHAISADGIWMAYPGVRDEKRMVDIFVRAVAGGEEKRLTWGEGHSDGPDFSHDGRRIYWNCDRGGHAQIWVMQADGSDQRQLFADDRVNWFPHPSPCGRWLVYLSYPPGTEGHPADLPVHLVLSSPEGAARRVIREFTGGQGTMNVPNWAPDGHAFACFRYEP
ncbi:MAG: TolB family protein [Rhodobacteraceae bacterium]|nr:TolB family protein [Paracoccaceae bacterium]